MFGPLISYPTRPQNATSWWLDNQSQLYLKIAARVLETDDWQKAYQILQQVRAEDRDSALSLFIESIIKRSNLFETKHLLRFVSDLAMEMADKRLKSLALLDYVVLVSKAPTHTWNNDHVVQVINQLLTLVSALPTEPQPESPFSSDAEDKTRQYIYFEMFLALIELGQTSLLVEIGLPDDTEITSLAAAVWLKAVEAHKDKPDILELADKAQGCISKVSPDSQKALFLARLGQLLLSVDEVKAYTLFEDALKVADSTAPSSEDILPDAVSMCLEGGYVDALFHLDKWCDHQQTEKSWSFPAKILNLDAKPLLEPMRFLQVMTYLKSTRHQPVRARLFDLLNQAINGETMSSSSSSFAESLLRLIEKARPKPQEPVRKGDNFEFDFDDIFSVDNDLFETAPKDNAQAASSSRQQIMLPPVVEDYHVRILAESGSIRDALVIVANAMVSRGSVKQETIPDEEREVDSKDRARRVALATTVAEIWAKRGDYKSALAAGMVAKVNGSDDCWKDIAKIAVERDELSAIEEVVQNHRAVQAGAYLYWALIECLNDVRVNDVFDNFLTHLNKVSDPIVTVRFLMYATVVTGLVTAEDAVNKLISFALYNDEETPEVIALLRHKGKIIEKDVVRRFLTQFDNFMSRSVNLNLSRSKEKSLLDQFENPIYPILFFLVAPTRSVVKGSMFAVQHYKHIDLITTTFIWLCIRMVVPVLHRKRKSIHYVAAIFYVFNPEGSDDFLDLDVLQSERLSFGLSILFKFLERCSEEDFASVGWDPEEVFELIQQLEDNEDRSQVLLVLSAAFALSDNDSQASRLVQQLSEVENKQVVVDGLLKYAGVLALLDKTDALVSIVNTAMSLWDERSEKRLRNDFRKLPDRLDSFLDWSDGNGVRKESDIVEIPIDEFGNVIAGLLSHGYSNKAVEILSRVSIPLRLHILYPLVVRHKSY